MFSLNKEPRIATFQTLATNSQSLSSQPLATLSTFEPNADSAFAAEMQRRLVETGFSGPMAFIDAKLGDMFHSEQVNLPVETRTSKLMEWLWVLWVC